MTKICHQCQSGGVVGELDEQGQWFCSQCWKKYLEDVLVRSSFEAYGVENEERTCNGCVVQKREGAPDEQGQWYCAECWTQCIRQAHGRIIAEGALDKRNSDGEEEDVDPSRSHPGGAGGSP